jgi:hypothetical protein
MSKIAPLLFVVVLTIMGCNAQRGRFSVTSQTYHDFSSNNGGIDVVQGFGSKPINTTDTGDENLLYLVIIGPNVQVHGSGSSADNEEYLTTLDYSWTTEKGELAVSTRWNRQTDIVSIGKKEFDREKSNLFIVRCETGRDMACQQLANLGPHVAFQGVLESIRKQLPNDKLITELTLFK